jgi:Mg2+ and Co2+ transporter CorA
LREISEVDKDVLLHFRVTQPEAEALRQYAKSEQKSLSQAIREALRDAIEKGQAQVLKRR